MIRAYVMGDPMDAKTTLGPIAQPNHAAELEEHRARREGEGRERRRRRDTAKVGGQRDRVLRGDARCRLPQKMALHARESFGPILPVAMVDSDDEALRLMNDSRFGLTASVWTATAIAPRAWPRTSSTAPSS